jgi:hypothetical protein
MAIVYLPDPRKCIPSADGSSYSLYVINRILSLTMALVIIVVFVILVIIDLVLNRRVLKSQAFKQFFQKDDPYFFRMETVLYGGTVVWVLFFGLASFTCSVALASGSSSERSLLLMQYFLDIAPDFFLVGIMTLFPLIITIYRWWKNHDIPRVKNQGILEEVLHDPEIHRRLKQFAEAEWSIENLLLYDDIREYEEFPTISCAERIINTYMSADAPLETNIPGRCLREVRELMKEPEHDQHLFDSTKNQVILNLTDTYSRFIFSEEYVEYKKRVDLKTDLINTIE